MKIFSLSSAFFFSLGLLFAQAFVAILCLVQFFLKPSAKKRHVHQEFSPHAAMPNLEPLLHQLPLAQHSAQLAFAWPRDYPLRSPMVLAQQRWKGSRISMAARMDLFNLWDSKASATQQVHRQAPRQLTTVAPTTHSTYQAKG